MAAYEQVVANSLLDPALDPATELVVDARSRGRYVPPTLLHITACPYL